MDFFSQLQMLISDLSGFVWGAPMLIMLIGTGMFLTYSLRGIQFTKLIHSLWLALVKRKEEGAEGDISNFQALMTALSATVGTGNVAGVATALAIGGPGAMFWMWVSGLLGMATKYGEAVLAVKYRVVDANGEMNGGPMYYISKGLNKWWLGATFAVFASIAALGTGSMVQSNSVADVLQTSFGVPEWITGAILLISCALVLVGGIKSIGRVTGVLVPIMIAFYIAGALLIVLMNLDQVPGAFALVFEKAFNPTAATGGFAGASVMLAVRMGVARGVFSNESGLGSSPIAAAAAQTNHPVGQALVSMTQTFIDTLIVCTLNGLVIIIAGGWSSGATGAGMTAMSFKSLLVGGDYIVSIGLALFAYSTILGWCYYGEKSIEFLFGERAVLPYRLVYIACIGVGAVMELNFLWLLCDLFNGLMAFPNLVGLLLLSPVIIEETKNYFADKTRESAKDAAVTQPAR